MSFNGAVVLENGLDLSQLTTTGSLIHLNEDFCEDNTETEKVEPVNVDCYGKPVKSIDNLEKHMVPVDKEGFVKKKVIEEGGGMDLHEGCTVSIVYSGYWENETDPFDVRQIHKPLVVDLKDNGLLPGMLIAVKSMLVGELSVFLLSYQVMYGEMGTPPRIKPKAKCVFYIKLVKSILTPKEGDINFSEPNVFQRVTHEVKLLYSSGVQLHKTKNYTAAIQLFKKAVYMLHKVRLADEAEEKIQEKFLIKLYTNLAICYNKTKQPLRACTACNEVHRLTNIYNNGKVLFQNAKALRMIGVFDGAAKKLERAIKLCPDSEEMKAELELLERTKESCNQSKLIVEKISGLQDFVTQEFKDEVDSLIENFKMNAHLCKLTLPSRLNDTEVEYIKEVCVRENVFCNRVQTNFALGKDDEGTSPDKLPEGLNIY